MLKALSLLALAASAPVCSIPVFRYALERWRAAPYVARVFHRGPLDAEARKLMAQLEAGGLNVAVEAVDVAKELSDEQSALWEPDKAAALPRLVLSYPERVEAVAWRGPLNAATVKALIDSPKRRETVKRLIEGTSVVWWLLESGDAAKDDAAAALMTTELERLRKQIKIATPGPEDPPLRSAIPLKVDFALLRVPKGAEGEAPFIETLARARRGWALPAVVPVFGRGRALGSLCGEEIQAPLITQMATYVTDACSCEVKELNPGVDLLFAADWDALLEAEPLPPEPERKVEPVVLQKPAAPKAPEPAPVLPTSDGTSRHLLWAGFATALAVALAAGVLAIRKGR